MCDLAKFSLVVVVLVSCVASAPTMEHAHAHGPPRSVDLMAAVNNTVCPIRVDVDEDPDRIPRRIKLLKCEPDPHEWCTHHHIPTRECCAHSSNRHVMECVEIHDKVLVKYPKTGKTKIYDVAVGCTCLVNRSNEAGTLPLPP